VVLKVKSNEETRDRPRSPARPKWPQYILRKKDPNVSYKLSQLGEGGGEKERAGFPRHRFADTDCPRSFHRREDFSETRDPRDLNQKIRTRRRTGVGEEDRSILPRTLGVRSTRRYLDSSSIPPRYWRAEAHIRHGAAVCGVHRRICRVRARGAEILWPGLLHSRRRVSLPPKAARRCARPGRHKQVECIDQRQTGFGEPRTVIAPRGALATEGALAPDRNRALPERILVVRVKLKPACLTSGYRVSFIAAAWERTTAALTWKTR